MSSSLAGRRVAFLVANEGVEQVELTTPWQAVEEAGGQPVPVAPEAGSAQAFHRLERADSFAASANWVDEPVHVDKHGPNVIISSRKPDDLPVFTEAMVAAFAAVPMTATR